MPAFYYLHQRKGVLHRLFLTGILELYDHSASLCTLCLCLKADEIMKEPKTTMDKQLMYELRI